ILLETTDLEWLKDGARDRHHSLVGEPLFMRVSQMTSPAMYISMYNFDGHPRNDHAQVVYFSTFLSVV
ncbi:MAG: hypothetical protein WCP99_18115, partial [Burkholderiales bacterium]